MSLAQLPARDFRPTQPDDVPLTENEIERGVEDALADLFNSGDPKATAWLVNEIHRDLYSVAASLIRGENDGEYYDAEQVVVKARADFVAYARYAPEWDFVRRQVEES